MKQSDFRLVGSDRDLFDDITPVLHRVENQLNNIPDTRSYRIGKVLPLVSLLVGLIVGGLSGWYGHEFRESHKSLVVSTQQQEDTNKYLMGEILRKNTSLQASLDGQVKVLDEILKLTKEDADVDQKLILRLEGLRLLVRGSSERSDTFLDQIDLQVPVDKKGKY